MRLKQICEICLLDSSAYWKLFRHSCAFLAHELVHFMIGIMVFYVNLLIHCIHLKLSFLLTDACFARQPWLLQLANQLTYLQ